MGEIKYWNKAEIKYWSERYGKMVTVEKCYPSDGATFAVDIYSDGWWVHDKVKDTRMFDDGTECTNVQASYMLYDILKAEGRWARARYWFASTLVFGEIKEYFSGLGR